jgi:hypothetical protein
MSTGPTAERSKNDVYTIIDPNPENHTINHEDLFIYASLKAKTKGRTFLTEDRTDNNNDEIRTIEIKTVDLVISDSASRGENKRTFLSTNWTEIGGSQFTDVNNRGDVEGFGITNVDIKIEGSYIPVVTVDFVDIRGATLFEQGSCSPYALFFHLPYPVFELTVKGYYGKPVTYYLNLVKFNTKFNSSTGNFEARGEFIGWSYAFLADILMGYVRCANYMDENWDAQKYLRKKYDETIEYYYDNGLFDESDYYTEDNAKSVYLESAPNEIIQPFCWQTDGGNIRCMTISDLLSKISDVENFLGRVKTDDQYVEAGNLTRVRNLLVEMRSELQKFNRELVSEKYKGYLAEGSPKLSLASDVKEKTRYVFNNEPDDTLKELLRDYLQRPIKGVNNISGSIVGFIGDIKNESVTKEGELPKKIGGQYVGVGSQTNTYPSEGLLPSGDDSVTEENSTLSFEMFDILKTQQFQNKMLDSSVKDSDGKQLFNYTNVNNSDGDLFYIDTGYITSIINKDLKTIDTELEKRRNTIKEEIDAGVTKRLGFRPTIRNVFTILSCNVENFIQLLLNCSIKAEEYHSQKKADYNQNFSTSNRRFSELRGVSGTDSETTFKNVYPWPTYYETEYKNETSYSSGKPETKEVYPGEKSDFYDWWEVKFVEDFIKACEKVNKDDEALLEDKTGIPGFDDYTPINPLESKIFGDTRLKYRDATTSLDSGEVDEISLRYIGERMFVTLDFSYYDPIRLNLINFGMGHNIPKRLEADKDKAQSLKEFNEQRLWFHTLYNKDKEVVENIAKIEAHNLLSCVDDETILRKLNQDISQGDLTGKVKNILIKTTNSQSSPNGLKPWFKDEVEYTDIFNHYNDPLPAYPRKELLKKVLNKNLNDIKGYDKSKKYWAYHPENGRIRLLGNASGNSLGKEDDPGCLYIYSDIRKMKEEELFQLFTEEEFDQVVTFQINYKGEEKTIDHRNELNTNLYKAIENKVKGYDCSSVYISYSNNEKTKLLYYNGENEDGKGLFTTLNIGVSLYDESQNVTPDSKYNIEYSCLPVYVTNRQEVVSGKYVSRYNKTPKQSSLFPFTQQTYQAFGIDRDFRYTEGSSSEPRGFTLEIPGKGVFENVVIKGLSKYKEPKTTDKIQERVDQTPFDKTAYSLLSSTNSEIKGRYKEWGSTFVSDTLVQLPIWLDNVNNFRLATTKGTTESRLDGMSADEWGNGRPLTNGSYELKSPTIGQIKKTSEKILTGNNQNEKAYTPEKIQNRNLAYLFLASCKPTPFITCGLAEPDPGTFGGASAVFNDKAEHYPKSIIPFLTSQGLAKIPKVWVYGMGSVLWRWKMYMGANKDSNGNIIWRNPIFREHPIGLDPLAQPGHPGYTERSGNESDPSIQRGIRSWSRGIDSSTTEKSYVNDLFKVKTLSFLTPVNNLSTLQTSCFASSAIRDVGLNRSLTGGRQNSGAEYGENPIAHGCNFDYWGVYNADKTLYEMGVPNSVRMPKRNISFYGGGGSQYGNSSWTTLWYHFIKPSKSPASPNYITRLLQFPGKINHPLDLSFRSAKEASANTFWPLLWITPWQHFYTEPVNSNSGVGPKLPSPNQAKNSIVEKTLTFIPVDHKWRDYVGNFGLLGDTTNNFSNRTLNATPDNTTYGSYPKKFSLPGKEISDTTLLGVNARGRITYSGFGEDTWVNLEGGKYAELIAFLPTFIKEKFVEEFEKWVDGDWASSYLKVIDPVNFDECKTDCLGKSYRVNPFISGEDQPLNKVLGTNSASVYTSPLPDSVGIISLDKKVNSVLGDLEEDLFNSYYYAMISTPKVFGLDIHDYTDGSPFYANEDLVKTYLESFQKEWKAYYEDKRKNIAKENEEGDNDTILDDNDIKLSLYRSFKSIVDKWISNTTDSKSNKPKLFFNITTNDLGEERTPLAAHFSYVNRLMGDIGNRAVLDVIRLKKIPENPKMSFYNLISDLLGENKFDFFPLPTFTNFTSKGYREDPNRTAKEMFSPYTNTIDAPSGPNFICMYVGGTSRVLDLKPKANCPEDLKDMEYNNDSFSLSDDTELVDKPYEYQNPEEPLAYNSRFGAANENKRVENGGLTAFKVAYGIENQNMFKSIELDQTEFSETNESLMVIDRLAKGGDPANRTEKGNNLHNVYLTRSYTCKVESLGNMMIQPLQYFDLTNIPMFYGTYLITKVEHNVKPHHITTNFTGVRQPIATVPIVEDVAVAINMKNITAVEGGNVLGGGSGGGSGGSGSVGENINQSRVTEAYPLYVTSELSVFDSRYGFAGKVLIEFTRDLEKYLQKKFPSKNIKFSNDNGAGPNIMRSLKATLKGGTGRVKNSKHGAGFAIDLLFEGTFTDNSGNSVSLGNPYSKSDTRKKYTWSQGNIPVAKDHKFMLEIKKFLDTSKWKDIIRWGASFKGDYTNSGRENIPGIGYNNNTVQNDEIHHFEIKDGILQNYIPEDIKKIIEKIGLKVPTKQTELTPIYTYPFDEVDSNDTDTDVDSGDGQPDTNLSVATLNKEENIRKIAEFLKSIGITKEGATGFIGNIIGESQVNPEALEIKTQPILGGNGGIGIVQWTGPRRRDLEKDANNNVDTILDLGFQLDYLGKELNNTYKKNTFEPLKKSKDIKDSTIIVLENFEKPGTFLNRNSKPSAYDKTINDRVEYAFSAKPIVDEVYDGIKPGTLNNDVSGKKYVVQSSEYFLTSNENSQRRIKFFKGLTFQIDGQEAKSKPTKNIQLVNALGTTQPYEFTNSSGTALKSPVTLHYKCDGTFYMKSSDGQPFGYFDIKTFKDSTGNLSKNLKLNLDLCKNTSNSLTPTPQTDCETSLKLGIDGNQDLSKVKNVIVGSSSVAVLGKISKDSTYGSLSSNKIYTYYNCQGKKLEWLRTQIKKDNNTYTNVKNFFQVGIGTNDGFPTSTAQKSQIEQYTNLVKEKFPNATLYVFPGTYGWGNVTNKTEKQVLDYYKQYTDLGWTLLRPKDSGGNFISSNLPQGNHDPSNEWFQGQMKVLKEKGS